MTTNKQENPMNEFNAVSMDGLTQVEGGVTAGLVAVVVAFAGLVYVVGKSSGSIADGIKKGVDNA
jgi:hypothetical protein